jgi:hypothetical protein
MKTAEQTAATATATPEAGTPLLEGTQQAHATVVVDDTKERTQLAMQRFEGVFHLEGEVVGATRRKVGKKGGVTLSLLPMNAKNGPSLTSLAKAAGEDVDAFKVRMENKLKGDGAALIGRISASNDWVQKTVKLDATGNRIAFAFERRESIEPAITETQALKALADKHKVTVEQLAEALSLVKPATAEVAAEATATAAAAGE